MNKKALTLTELLISIMLIGIVMIGIVAFTFAIRQIQESANKSAVASFKVSAAIGYMTRDGIKATGHEGNRGIIGGEETSPPEYLCFRQDFNDVSSYADDKWVCYTLDNNHTLWRCDNLNTTVDDCSAQASKIVLAKGIQSDFFDIVLNAQSRIQRIEVHVTAVNNPSKPVDPITNPSFSVYSDIHPHSHSF